MLKEKYQQHFVSTVSTVGIVDVGVAGIDSFHTERESGLGEYGYEYV